MKLFLAALAVLLALLLGYGINRLFPGLRSGERRAWKDAAVQAVAERVSKADWIARETNALSAPPEDFPSQSEAWLSPALVLMKNGEWIAHTNVCRKANKRIRDLYLGRGSDGKWYYSTYHFCVGMYALKMREATKGQPTSIAEFAKEYCLREFDGKSDDSLQKTWPER